MKTTILTIMQKFFIWLGGLIGLSVVAAAMPSESNKPSLFRRPMRKRGCDAGGCGHFGAPRSGNRTHKGFDVLCENKEPIYSIWNGTAERVVTPYEGDVRFSGIKIRTTEGYEVKVMYLKPNLNIITHTIKVGDLIGYSQDISTKYPSVKPHLHIEILKDNKWLDPEPFLFPKKA